MGFGCSKRATWGETVNAEVDWEVIELPKPAQSLVQKFLVTPPVVYKFQRIVRKVQDLLQLRKLWSRLGRSLVRVRPGNFPSATPASLVEEAHLALLRRVWALLGLWLRPASFSITLRDAKASWCTRGQDELYGCYAIFPKLKR